MRLSRQLIAAAAAGLLVAGAAAGAAPAALAAWTASASASFSQTVQPVPSASWTKCTTDAANNATRLEWTAAPATLNGSAFKEYAIEWRYVDTDEVVLTATRADPYAVPTSNGLRAANTYVKVTFRYQNGLTSVSPTSYQFTYATSNASGMRPVCSPEKTS